MGNFIVFLCIYKVENCRFVAEENHQPGEEIMRESGDMDPRMKYFYVEMDASVMHTMVSYTYISLNIHWYFLLHSLKSYTSC